MRKITKGIVEQAVANPDKAVVGRMNRKIALKRHTDKWLKVVFEESEDIRVITALNNGEYTMKVEYDDDADALYIAIRKGSYEISEEISDDVILDLDKNCRILGIEILGVSDKIDGGLLKQILQAERVPYELRT